MDDDAFVTWLTGQLAGLSGVDAVTLGGWRATGTERPDSDWDFALYHRGGFDPGALRAKGFDGWAGGIGSWGGGVMNGGALVAAATLAEATAAAAEILHALSP